VTQRDKTLRGFADPKLATPPSTASAAADEPQGPVTNPAMRPPSPSIPPKKSRGRPMLEVEVVHSHGPAPSIDPPWKVVEIWTQNHVYVLDPQMACVEVIDRISKKSVRRHAFLGMRLVGGQHREGEQIELSCPFPRPGTEAVFEHPKGRAGNFSQTSPVARVVLRLHIATVAPGSLVPSWEEITGAFTAPVLTR
jgi:hypothetical protein